MGPKNWDSLHVRCTKSWLNLAATSKALLTLITNERFCLESDWNQVIESFKLRKQIQAFDWHPSTPTVKIKIKNNTLAEFSWEAASDCFLNKIRFDKGRPTGVFHYGTIKRVFNSLSQQLFACYFQCELSNSISKWLQPQWLSSYNKKSPPALHFDCPLLTLLLIVQTCNNLSAMQLIAFDFVWVKFEFNVEAETLIVNDSDMIG